MGSSAGLRQLSPGPTKISLAFCSRCKEVANGVVVEDVSGGEYGSPVNLEIRSPETRRELGAPRTMYRLARKGTEGELCT